MDATDGYAARASRNSTMSVIIEPAVRTKQVRRAPRLVPASGRRHSRRREWYGAICSTSWSGDSAIAKPPRSPVRPTSFSSLEQSCQVCGMRSRSEGFEGAALSCGRDSCGGPGAGARMDAPVLVNAGRRRAVYNAGLAPGRHFAPGQSSLCHSRVCADAIARKGNINMKADTDIDLHCDPRRVYDGGADSDIGTSWF
jgi:hypothetical protein